MMAIQPSQVGPINAAFTPSTEEVARAQAIVDAFAANPGVGVPQVDGKMVDAPHLKQAHHILSLADCRPNPPPVRIERSRDAPRPCATTMGDSTSLDTNGGLGCAPQEAMGPHPV